MKLILVLVYIVIFNLSTFIDCQNLYANFIPYTSEGCKDESIEGIGFSFVATTGNCYNNIGKSFNQVFDSQEYSLLSSSSSSQDGELVTSWLVVIDALRVGVAEFLTENGTCSGSFINANSIKNGTCLNTPNFIPFIGEINSKVNLTQQYSLVTITKEPYYPSNVQVYSIYENESSDCNIIDLYYSIYFTSGLNLTLKNNNQYIVTQCNNGGIASNLLCSSSSTPASSSNCNKVIIPDACNNYNNDYGFDQIYCTSP